MLLIKALPWDSKANDKTHEEKKKIYLLILNFFKGFVFTCISMFSLFYCKMWLMLRRGKCYPDNIL